MVANIGPASYNYEETFTTLRYANRAKHIRNKPQINEDPKDALLRSFQVEISRLKATLQSKKTRSSKRRTGDHDLKVSMEHDDLNAKEAELEQEKEDIMNNSELIAEERDQLLLVTDETSYQLMNFFFVLFATFCQTLQGKQAELHKKRENQDKLAARIEALESKLLTGNIGTAENITIEDVTKQQQETLEAHKQEIIETEVLFFNSLNISGF